MKVKQLIKKLNKLNPEARVILSSNAEGNHHRFLNKVNYSNGMICTWEKNDNEVIISEGDIDFIKKDVGFENVKDCIVLYPE